ncbi:MAG: calcium-binding protein, partial [Cyanobacteria bacterium P01_D01_bin.73]
IQGTGALTTTTAPTPTPIAPPPLPAPTLPPPTDETPDPSLPRAFDVAPELGVPLPSNSPIWTEGDDTLIGAQIDGDGKQWLNGSLGDDLIFGNLEQDVITGGPGDDSLFGGQGDDWIKGSPGFDVLAGDLGNDTLIGDVGGDRFVIGIGRGSDIVLDFLDGTDRFFLEPPLTFDQLTFEANGDDTQIKFENEVLITVVGVAPNLLDADDFATTLEQVPVAAALSSLPRAFDVAPELGATLPSNSPVWTNGNDTIIGAELDGDGRQWLNGGPGDDVIFGNLEQDVLTGGPGDDLLFGGQGDDWIKGSAGFDTLAGDAGNDTLIGDIGSDRFVIGAGRGSDILLDFTDNVDRILLEPTLTFPQLTLEASGNSTQIRFGDELLVTVIGVAPALLDASDFATLE